MTHNNATLKSGAKVAVGVMVLLLIGSIIYYKERVLFGDGSFMLFNIINLGQLNVQWGRYGATVSQFLPLLAVKMSLPITIVALFYSVGFNIFYLLSVAFCYWCRQYALTILAAFYYTLFFSDSFYWVSEVPQAMGWLFITLSVMMWCGERKVSAYILYPVYSILLFITISTHFVVIIPLIFLLVFLFTDGRLWPFSKQNSIMFSVLLVSIILFRSLMVGESSGENSHLHNVTHFSIKDIYESFVTPVVTSFNYHLLTIYWPALFVFAIGVYTLIKQKGKIGLRWTILVCVGYYIIMGLTYGYYQGEYAVFHIESEWSALSVVMSAAFVYNFLGQQKTKTMLLLLLAIFGVRLGYIYNSASAFSIRNEMKEKILAKMHQKGLKKVALYENIELSDLLILDWALPEELLLTSAMNGDKPQLTCRLIRKADTATLKSTIMMDKISFEFVALPNSDLNARYFSIDTSNSYTLLPYEELMK